ncbi:hypothetical protein GMLC_04960 [Geomonas limicola]|uniref:Ice-binding protein C-terminal domain-containing protein n=1 Tax=Geomonas limicola TaxID=2740186 RepID=A0A6V8N509_9BACT|nr:PEP-CTERM sorting domain-containing protein [Geomonas limicola]GFO66917.1 hypothetical protein GMLC_04960 [Geomonas limicola]
MRRGLERALSSCSAASRGWTILILAVLVLACATPARATLIGSPVSHPDLTISYLEVTPSAGTISAASSSLNPYLDLWLNPLVDVFLTGSYLLSYNEISHSGHLTIQGTIDDTQENFLISGAIIQFGSSGDGKAYDFLVQLDAIDPVLSACGFGGVGSVIYTDLLHNGDIWQSDTVPAAVPEPGTVMLVASGMTLAALWRRRES